MSYKVLVTGVSGFLGGHIALELALQGYTVRGSVRDGRRANDVRSTMWNHGANVGSLEFVELDLMRDEGWDEAMEGVDFVQHVASPFVIDMPDDPQDLIRPAVEGTERAVRAALTAGVERVVITSSMAAIMYGHDAPREAAFTADDWTDLDNPTVNAYARSKTLAERRAWEVADELGAREKLTCVNPSAIYGPLLDEDPGTSALLLQRLLRGDMPGVPPMILPAIDVRDVAAVHVAAMTSPQVAGSRIPLSSQSLSLLEMSNHLREAFPEYAGKLPTRQLPAWFVRIYARFDKQVRDNTAEMVPERKIDAGLARQLLGKDFIPAREAVAAMAQSLIHQKLV